MIYIIGALVALSGATLVFFLAQLLPSRPEGVAEQLANISTVTSDPFAKKQIKARKAYREQIEQLLQGLGERYQFQQEEASRVRQQLIQAGFRQTNALAVYRGARIGLPFLSLAMGVLLLPADKGPLAIALVSVFFLYAWFLPAMYVNIRIRRRQKELQLALPDALDSLVVCVEAGLGLSQAMVRVAQEIKHISMLMSIELTQTNLEIRAGVPRDEALRHLAERTGLADLRSLSTMLIQADRFGTSIAQALRVLADTLREKRRQRAEEIVNKMAIKLLFPLVVCIFPALFVMALGPTALQIIEALKTSPF